MFFISFLSRSFFRALVQIEPITLHNESYIWWTIIHPKFLKNFIDKGFLRTKNAFKSIFIDLNTNDIRCLTHILYVKSFREIVSPHATNPYHWPQVEYYPCIKQENKSYSHWPMMFSTNSNEEITSWNLKYHCRDTCFKPYMDFLSS
jgi:hypothetical protein